MILSSTKNRKKTGQAMAEFVILTPLLLFILLAGFKLFDLALKAQKLEMASYYAARLYSKHSIRGVRRGTIYNYTTEKNKVLNETVKPRIYKYLNTENVQITNETENKIKLKWPVTIAVSIAGFTYSKEIVLQAYAEMENDPLEYAGGRNADDE